MRNNAKFNREHAIDKARDLYWKKGFHGTSMRHLQEVMDMRPGSIYTAFGSKENLFEAALASYTHAGIAQLAQLRKVHASPIEALKAFMTLMIIERKACAPSPLCMLAKTVAELTDEHSTLLEAAKNALTTMEHEFEKLLIEAQDMGLLGVDKNPTQLARQIQIQITGMRTYSITCNDNALLAAMIDDLFTHYPFD